MRALAGLGLLSAAVLLSQVALIRVFSIAQFYHFAFLVISLALLGFGASGSLLALTWLGSERAVLLSTVLGAGAALILAGAPGHAAGQATGRATRWATRA